MASSPDSKCFSMSELDQIQANFQTGGVDEVIPLVQKKFQELQTVELNIAVTGVAGSGKSTFINAMRSLKRNDEGAASTGNKETTLEPTRYSHPTMKGIYFWDLPGIGTSTFKAKDYLKKMKFNKFDLFIIISFQRFTENDTLLAKEIKRLGKNFYFIRSKVDNDLDTFHKQGIDYNKEAELEKIRNDCVSHLKKAGIQSPSIFLISSFKLDQFDFPDLRDTLANDLPDSKKEAFNLSIQNIILKQKIKNVLPPSFRDLIASPLHTRYFNKKELEQLQAAYQAGGLEHVTSLIQKKLQELESVELHIAVTGVTGSGKSTFINTIRGLSKNDERAAPTGNIETTLEATRYPHPNIEGVYFWDLPGIGSSTFKAKEYLNKVEFNRFDFFIVISHTRFTENDTLLVKEINHLGKKFYFVRSQVDNDLDAFDKEGIDCNKETELENIRKDCVSNLKNAGIASVFLISGIYLDQFDFPILRETLANDLPDIKKDVFILSIPNTTVEIMEQKRKILKQRIWMLAAVSAAVGVTPLPGVSFAFDIGLITSAIIYFRKCVGLDDASLERLAKSVGKPVEELKAVIKTPLVGKLNKRVVIRSVLGIIGISICVLEIVLKFIPVVGSAFGVGSSFVMTYKLLNAALDDLVENAQNVLKVVTTHSSPPAATCSADPHMLPPSSPPPPNQRK